MSVETKGIILAAGKGTRLMPATLPASKPLLPLYDKPMIYYPLETLVRIGIKDILFIVQEDDLPIFQKTFGSGEDTGLNFSYKIQKVQRGISDAYFIAEDYLDGASSVLALSDNVFLGKNFFTFAEQALDKMKQKGSAIFGLPVPDPEKFGVIELDKNDNIIGIIEKPKEIHIQSWKEIIAQSSSSHNFQYEQVNFDMFWNCIFQDDYFAFAAKNEDKFMGIIVGRINETYYQKIIELDVLFVLPDFRKIGVARALVNKIESIAKEKKLDLIIKGVEKSNLLAQKLFKNYEEISRTRFLKKA